MKQMYHYLLQDKHDIYEKSKFNTKIGGHKTCNLVAIYNKLKKLKSLRVI
jgi:hypothetical protein